MHPNRFQINRSISAMFLSMIVIACSNSSENNELSVSAAISLKEPLCEIANSFEHEHPGTKIVFNFASSGQLAQQIVQGAPVDIFLSASSATMRKLETGNFVRKASAQRFASNEIVLIARRDAAVIKPGDLGKLRLLAIGNPETVPVGAYAREALRKRGLYDRLIAEKKIVFAENDRQILSFVESGNVDAGIVYRSDLGVSTGVQQLMRFAKDEAGDIEYLISLTRNCKQEKLASQFESYVLSESSQKIFQSRGFLK